MRARLREVFSEGTVAVLATSSRETGPASTLVSWLVLREDGVVALALDRRGRAYENARSDPRASLEVFDVSGGLAVRGVDVRLKLVGVLPSPGPRMHLSPLPERRAIVETAMRMAKRGGLLIAAAVGGAVGGYLSGEPSAACRRSAPRPPHRVAGEQELRRPGGAFVAVGGPSARRPATCRCSDAGRKSRSNVADCGPTRPKSRAGSTSTKS
jgi:hypothetical protein